MFITTDDVLIFGNSLTDIRTTILPCHPNRIAILEEDDALADSSLMKIMNTTSIKYGDILAMSRATSNSSRKKPSDTSFIYWLLRESKNLTELIV